MDEDGNELLHWSLEGKVLLLSHTKRSATASHMLPECLRLSCMDVLPAAMVFDSLTTKLRVSGQSDRALSIYITSQTTVYASTVQQTNHQAEPRSPGH